MPWPAANWFPSSPPTLGFHALYTSRRYQPAAHRSLLDFLAERMANADF